MRAAQIGVPNRAGPANRPGSRQLFSSALVVLGLCGSPVIAETAILRNGETIRGTVVQQSMQDVSIRLADGSVRTILKKDMYRLKFQDLSEQEAAKIRKEEEIRQKTMEKMQAERAIADAKRQVEIDEMLAYETKLRKQYDEEVARQIDDQIKARTRGGTPALWRSALVPGWGQWYQGHEILGGVFLGLCVAGSGYTYSRYASFTKDRSHYEKHPGAVYALASNSVLTYAGYQIDKRALEKANRSGQGVATAGALTMGIYAINLVHSYFFSAKVASEQPAAPGTKVGLDTQILSSTHHDRDVRNEIFITLVF